MCQFLAKLESQDWLLWIKIAIAVSAQSLRHSSQWKQELNENWEKFIIVNEFHDDGFGGGTEIV